MENLEKGKFYGTSKKQYHLNGLTIVNSEFYHYTNCPWHYHQNPHFAFTTKGNLIETHKNKQIQLSPGCLLYNHSQEPHWNSRYSELVAALHVDIDINWFKKYDIKPYLMEGVREVRNPVLKNLFFHIFKEVKCPGNASNLAIESLMIQSVNEMVRSNQAQTLSKPGWFLKIKDLLYAKYNEKLSLQEIALEINIHPVYLCQQFPIYFNCTFGDYIRKIKIEKSVELMFCNPGFPLTGIAYHCGFFDQSHFIRLFKKNIGITPFKFRRMILRS